MRIVRTDRYDFVVAGGGPAGFAASMAKGSFPTVDVAQLREALWQGGLLDPDTLPFT